MKVTPVPGTRSASAVNVPTLIWDYPGARAVQVLARDTLARRPVTIHSFFIDVGDSPIWYRLFVDDEGFVRRAEMRAKGHFMNHTYFALASPSALRPRMSARLGADPLRIQERPRTGGLVMRRWAIPTRGVHHSGDETAVPAGRERPLLQPTSMAEIAGEPMLL